MDFQVGSKVTVCRRDYRGEFPTSIATITAITPRRVKTDDGSQWHPKFGYALDANGRVFKTKSIRLTKDGDDRTIQRLAFAEQAKPLLSPIYSQHSPLENLSVISDADLHALAEIAQRYDKALKARLALETG